MKNHSGDYNLLLEVCDKLDQVKDCRLSKKGLYGFMMNPNVLVCFSNGDDKKMNGCVVYFVTEDISGDKILYVIFQWIDSHYLKLWKEYMVFAEEKAKKLKVKRISFTTNRSEKAIKRKMGEYGYFKAYSIFEKEVR